MYGYAIPVEAPVWQSFVVIDAPFATINVARNADRVNLTSLRNISLATWTMGGILRHPSNNVLIGPRAIWRQYIQDDRELNVMLRRACSTR